jgi:hypothetical protein
MIVLAWGIVVPNSVAKTRIVNRGHIIHVAG